MLPLPLKNNSSLLISTSVWWKIVFYCHHHCHHQYYYHYILNFTSKILGWPKSWFELFHDILRKSLNEVFGQQCMEVVFSHCTSMYTISLIVCLCPFRTSLLISVKVYSLNVLLRLLLCWWSCRSFFLTLGLVLTKLQSPHDFSFSFSKHTSCSCLLVLRFQQSSVSTSAFSPVILPPFHYSCFPHIFITFLTQCKFCCHLL